MNDVGISVPNVIEKKRYLLLKIRGSRIKDFVSTVAVRKTQM